jgi:hypothetical protein
MIRAKHRPIRLEASNPDPVSKLEKEKPFPERWSNSMLNSLIESRGMNRITNAFESPAVSAAGRNSHCVHYAGSHVDFALSNL